MVRFRSRHVHQTLVSYLKTGLDDLGWVTPPVVLSTRPVTFLEAQPEEGGITVAPNTIAITLGDEPADADEELGAAHGGLESCDYTLFVDIYGANNTIAMALADDIKMLLKGQYLTLRDYTAGPPGVPTQHMIEMDFVVVDRPLPTTAIDKRFWRTVKATARLYFNE